MSEENNTDKEDNIAFLQYVRETEKFPVEMEALRSTIKSNNSTVELAESTKTHFEDSRKNNNLALRISVGVGILTLIVLLVQTYSIQRTNLENPIELNEEQLIKMINSDKLNNSLIIEQLDTVKSHLIKKAESENKKLKDLLRTERQNNWRLNQKLDSLLSKFENLEKNIKISK